MLKLRTLVLSTITAIQQEYKKCKWDFSEGKWLKVRGTADALLLVRLAEGKLAAQRTLKWVPASSNSRIN